MVFRWAISSTGKIAADFAQAIRQLPGHEVRAVASRSRASAAAFAEKHCPGASALTNGEAADVDATYVCGPNDTHALEVTRLLEAGRAVLCEKSLATNMSDVERLVALSKQRSTFLMEGMWTRCFPATVKARDLLAQGVIGDVVGVQAEFGYDIENGCPASLRGDAETGGITMDIGIYLAEKALLAYPASMYDCIDTRATSVDGVADGVDLSAAASLHFSARNRGPSAHERAQGGLASLFWTGLVDTPETCSIIGSRGAIVFDQTAHTPSTLLLRRRVTRTQTELDRFDFPPPNDDGLHVWNYPGSICLQYEALAVERAVASSSIEAPEWPHDDTLAAHRILHDVKADLKRTSAA